MIEIPESEVVFKASRASGAGGQAVNKTSSRVELRWDLGASSLLDEDQKQLVRTSLSNRINKNDVLVLHVEDERSQARNKEVALEHLNEFVNIALNVPEERRPTKVPRREKEKRLQDKKHQSQKKAIRKTMSYDE